MGAISGIPEVALRAEADTPLGLEFLYQGGRHKEREVRAGEGAYLYAEVKSESARYIRVAPMTRMIISGVKNI